jgi:dihydrofolate reductase
MATGHVFIASSLDGFIARRNGQIDWLSHPGMDNEDHGYDAFMATIDGLIMGRGTYEMARSFGSWPYPKPVIVLSHKLADSEVPADLVGRVRFWNSRPSETMELVKAEGWNRVYIDGGKTIQAFLQEGLIAEMIITRIPILIGTGLPLFGPTEKDIKLKHQSTKSFPSGLVQSHYEVGR